MRNQTVFDYKRKFVRTYERNFIRSSRTKERNNSSSYVRIAKMKWNICVGNDQLSNILT